MESKMFKFKISGIMMFLATSLWVLMSRNSELIRDISNAIIITIDRIMICDYISLFMVLGYLFLFAGILPVLTFEIKFGIE